MNRFLTASAYIVICLLLIWSRYSVGQKTAPITTENTESSTYSLLAKRIFIENPNDSFVNFSGLRTSLQQHMTEQQIDGSIYFEYLPTGTSIRINADQLSVAASLIKLPVAMELYRGAELGVLDLNQTVTLQESWLDSGYGTLYQKGAGYQLSLREAAEILLKDSDNTALKAIAFTMQDKVSVVEKPLNFMDVDFQQNTNLTVSVTPRSYASFLKCLYFSCYLSKEHSQELLSYLSDTSFPERIVAGVNNNQIKVAHKTGNYAGGTQSDCGIVYIPKRNYVLCVMVSAKSDADGDEKISEISRIAYEYVQGL